MGNVITSVFENSTRVFLAATEKMERTFFEGSYLQCPVCKDTYDKKNRMPKVLPCHHTFCLHCIGEMFNRTPASSSTSRPASSSTSRPASSSTSRPASSSTSRPASSSTSRPALSSTSRPASSSTSRPASSSTSDMTRTIKCPTCRKECSLSDQELSNLPPDHQVIWLEDFLPQTNEKNLCQEHTNLPLNFFCKTCSSPICRDCTVVEHKEAKGHEITDIKSALAEHEIKVCDIEKKTEAILNQLGGRLEALDNAKGNLETAKHEIAHRIETQFEEYHKILKQRQTILTAKAEEFLEDQQRKIQTEHDDVRKSGLCLLKLHCTLKLSKDTNNVRNIFTMRNIVEGETSRFQDMAQEDDTQLFQSCQFVDQNDNAFGKNVEELGEIQQILDASLRDPPQSR